jgi:hypothetical protein
MTKFILLKSLVKFPGLRAAPAGSVLPVIFGGQDKKYGHYVIAIHDSRPYTIFSRGHELLDNEPTP